MTELPLANNALWCGIGSFFCLGMFLGVAAVIMGIVALSKINAEPHRYTGQAKAGWGIGLGLASALLWMALLRG